MEAQTAIAVAEAEYIQVRVKGDPEPFFIRLSGRSTTGRVRGDRVDERCTVLVSGLDLARSDVVSVHRALRAPNGRLVPVLGR